MRDIIAIGASSGGIQALKELTAGLPADLPASIFIVVHMLPTAASILPDILGKMVGRSCINKKLISKVIQLYKQL